MGSLNRDAISVVRAGRSALQATAADRERIEQALAARLGPHTFPPSTAVASGARMLAVRVMAGAAVGASLVGGVIFLGSSPRATGPEKPTTTESVGTQVAHPSPVPPVVANPAPPAVVEPAETTATGPAERAGSAPASAARRPDALTQEVALMSRAVAALNAGRAGEALAALNEHQRQFPRGILNAERQAAKAQALCSLGRLTEGRAQLTHLSPQSPAANRARQVCDAASARRQRDEN